MPQLLQKASDGEAWWPGTLPAPLGQAEVTLTRRQVSNPGLVSGHPLSAQLPNEQTPHPNLGQSRPAGTAGAALIPVHLGSTSVTLRLGLKI